MPRALTIATTLSTLLAACGGPDTTSDPSGEPIAADAPPAATEALERTCVPLGNGCAEGRTYQMCCAGSDCLFQFDDGHSFDDIDTALVYCTTGVPLSEPGQTAAPTDPNLGGGQGPTGGTREAPEQPGGPNDPDPAAPAGQGGDTGGSSNSSGGACYGSVTSCQARNGPSSCRAEPGCYYQYEMCEGSAWSCQSFGSPSGCSGQLGCYWSYHYDQCLGASVSCGSRSSSGSCHGQYGCRWRDGACLGSVRQCYGYYNESSCRATNGCYWR